MFRAAVAFGTAGAIAKGCKRGLCLFNLVSKERKVRREAGTRGRVWSETSPSQR